jgi:hypothetical protein
MTAAADNRKYTGTGTELTRDKFATSWNGPIAANVKLFTGTVAGALLSDTSNNPALSPFVAGGTMRPMGFVTLGADNTVGQATLGALPVRVSAGTGALIDKNAGGGAALTIANLFRPVYLADNQTCSALQSDGDIGGVLTGFDAFTGQPIVLIDPWIAQELAISTSIAVAQDIVSLGASTLLAQLTPPASGLYRVTIVISAHTNSDTVTATVGFTDAVEGFASTLTPISAVVLTHDSNTGTTSASVTIRASAAAAIKATMTVSGQTTTKASAIIERLN